MGFSLVGNSGDSSTSTTNYNYTAESNPQQDFGGSGGGALGINISPLDQGGSVGEISPQIYDYYAPVSIVSTGDNLGDAAVTQLASLTAATQTSTANGTASAADSSTGTSNTTIYIILGAIVVFFLAEN